MSLLSIYFIFDSKCPKTTSAITLILKLLNLVNEAGAKSKLGGSFTVTVNGGASNTSWGGNDAGESTVCPPGCGCESPAYGASKVNTNAQNGGEMFFSWDKAAVGDSRRQMGSAGSISGRSKGRFRQ